MRRKPPGKPPSQRGKRKRSVYGSDESCSPLDIKATAYHEAGHAVAATVLGTGLLSVDIKGHSLLETGMSPTTAGFGKYLGYARYIPDNESAAFESQRRIQQDPDLCRRLMIVASAGPSAEAAVLLDEENQGGYDDDKDRVMNLAAIACCESVLQSDGQISVPGDVARRASSEIEATISNCYLETEYFLRDHWAAIKAVAMALLDRKSLTGAEVAEIVETSLIPA